MDQFAHRRQQGDQDQHLRIQLGGRQTFMLQVGKEHLSSNILTCRSYIDSDCRSNTLRVSLRSYKKYVAWNGIMLPKMLGWNDGCIKWLLEASTQCGHKRKQDLPSRAARLKGLALDQAL